MEAANSPKIRPNTLNTTNINSNKFSTRSCDGVRLRIFMSKQLKPEVEVTQIVHYCANIIAQNDTFQNKSAPKFVPSNIWADCMKCLIKA